MQIVFQITCFHDLSGNLLCLCCLWIANAYYIVLWMFHLNFILSLSVNCKSDDWIGNVSRELDFYSHQRQYRPVVTRQLAIMSFSEIFGLMHSFFFPLKYIKEHQGVPSLYNLDLKKDLKDSRTD